MNWKRQCEVTPFGSQTLSKRAEAMVRPFYPVMASAGRGCHLFAEGKDYIDFVCALGAVTIGYGEPAIFGDLQVNLNLGCSLSLPTELEGKSASVFVDHCEWIDSVRFIKTGTEANSAAIRIARIATSRSGILMFEGNYHGWSDAAQSMSSYSVGIPKRMKESFSLFKFPSTEHEWSSLRIELASGFYAAVILEPVNFVYDEQRKKDLQFLRNLCSGYGTLLIFDEVLSGFRYSTFGIAEASEVHPDLSAYGKCLAQGLPLACVAGRKDIMAHAWVISGTFGGEQVSLQAFLNVYKFYEENQVAHRLELIGQHIKADLIDLEDDYSIGLIVKGSGPRLQLSFLQDETKERLSVFLVCCLREGLFLHGSGGLNMMYRHLDELGTIRERFGKAFASFCDPVLYGMIKEQMVIPQPAWRDR